MKLQNKEKERLNDEQDDPPFLALLVLMVAIPIIIAVSIIEHVYLFIKNLNYKEKIQLVPKMVII